ncbi:MULTISPECIES: asparagine synthase-related protein [Thermococcus]|uniref:Putative ATPase, PP-loop superfamily n=1 Tax=Thermococcus sibiricus TaxID=172049 RepID=A0A117L1B4_9EURY|nr:MULTISPECIES: asparagine synthase-related protein [Thermococcus]KUK17331.1 MAG: putative ATPase, PP-loop superfamily [Thermococcus sibiricus]KUK28521.1 MAG: putative ATPase, PP-loop superfamily [Thermococcus sp. 40_45]MBC7095858.1 7-cyano-7-deazaguanine synthase [Thermococcus sp.]HII67375.1 hypothetical protein [Thermococcaceae archaeon]
MEVYHLYSGGKDSSLAAYILKRLGYEVKLVTVNFGFLDSWKYARETAQSLGFEHEVFFLDRKILEKATEMCINDKHPNNAIQFIHEMALEEIARREDVKRISDGTRRDDRVPLLDQRKTRSLEDRFNVQYIRPLLGLGYKTIRELTDRLFIIELKESEKLEKSDYETEIRYFLREKGIDPLTIFPERHLQSRVLGWKRERAHL